MFRPLKLIGSVIALMILLMGGLYGYRRMMLYEGRTPEGYQLLTALPASQSFEPKALPDGPLLENQSPGDLAVNFGYKVGAIPYSYSIALRFPESGDTGRATVTVRHATRDASIEMSTARRWDEPRKAYAVALQGKFDVEPAVPSLCIKVLIGRQTKSYDLREASSASRNAMGPAPAIPKHWLAA